MSERIAPRLSNPDPFISKSLDDFFTPSTLVEIDAGEAERMGAFEESALSYDDALEANLMGEAV